MIFRDLVYAVRALRKTPSFSAIVVSTLALAIGANAAVFSILHAVVLAPLPYADPDRLVAIEPTSHGRPFVFSLPEFADVVRAMPAQLDGAAAFTETTGTLTDRGKPRKLSGFMTTPDLFATLGVAPLAGRFMTAADAARGAQKTIVVSRTLYRAAFGADPATIGSFVRIDGNAYRVIGVAPDTFRQPLPQSGFANADFWTVVPADGAGTQYGRGWHAFYVVARVRPGVALAAARAALASALATMRVRHPSDDTSLDAALRPLADSLVGNVRPLLFAIFAAVGLVLLVACANVANLLLSRAASREREFSVRIAIGASRGRIVAQLLVETFALAVAGGALGIALAYGVVAAFTAAHPANIPRADAVAVDGAAIAYTFGIVAFCTIAAGLAPAFTSAQRDVTLALKSAGRGGDAHRGARARNALVACEIAMTLALVIAAGLVVRSFIALTAQPLGFDGRDVAIVGPVDLPDRRYATDAARNAFYADALARVRALPGVVHAAWSYSVPFTNDRMGTTFTIAGRPVQAGHEPDATMAPAGSDFFATMHAVVRSGRAFGSDDGQHAEPVAIVNATFARRFFPGVSPIGASITPSISIGPGRPPLRRIVGVVDDLRSSFTQPADATIYVPEPQMPVGSYLLVRSAPGVDVSAAAATAAVARDPLLAVPPVVTMRARLAENVGVQRLTVAALSTLAFVALALSIAGVFAVVSYGVTQRTHEFGVRMALGADARQIVRMVLGGALRLALVGVALGLLVAGAGTRLLANQLYDTQPLDPLTFGSVTVLVMLAALLAAFVPARRATRVDPIVALRYE